MVGKYRRDINGFVIVRNSRMKDGERESAGTRSEDDDDEMQRNQLVSVLALASTPFLLCD